MKGLAQKAFDQQYGGSSGAPGKDYSETVAQYHAGTLGDRMRTLINPGWPIPPEATDVHGIGDADVASAPLFADVGERIGLRLIGEGGLGGYDLIAGYNAGFDVRMLNAEWERAGLPYFLNPDYALDPLVVVRHRLRHLRGRKLTSVCEHFGIKLVATHRADADATATAELILRMVADGLIPDDVEWALDVQAKRAAFHEKEHERWGYWLYQDRARPDLLRIGCGKHCGAALADVPADYVAYVLEHVEDMHPGARAALADHLASHARVAAG